MCQCQRAPARPDQTPIEVNCPHSLHSFVKKKSKLRRDLASDWTVQTRPEYLSQWLEVLSAVRGLHHDRGALQTVVSRGGNSSGIYKVTTSHHTGIITDILISGL